MFNLQSITIDKAPVYCIVFFCYICCMNKNNPPSNARIIDCLQPLYGITIDSLTPITLGADINKELLSYYRYERIIEDIAEYCQQLLMQSDSDQDRSQMHTHFLDMFTPNGFVAIACKKR